MSTDVVRAVINKTSVELKAWSGMYFSTDNNHTWDKQKVGLHSQYARAALGPSSSLALDSKPRSRTRNFPERFEVKDCLGRGETNKGVVKSVEEVGRVPPQARWKSIMLGFHKWYGISAV